MDDYPRGPPHAGELHLDLISWMGFFTRTMRDMANFVGEEDDEKNFAEIEQAILENIEGMLELCFYVIYLSFPEQIYTGTRRSKCTVTLILMKMVIIVNVKCSHRSDDILQRSHIMFATRVTCPYSR